MSTLYYRERVPAGEPEGLLVLNHGRGSDELDLLGLADVLDPGRRLLVVSPRGAAAAGGLTRLPLVPGAAGRATPIR